jgi:hypothetical protein
MIAVGVLSASTVRDTYLRGINLGGAWHGPSGDRALNALLFAELARAEELMGIHWNQWRVSADVNAYWLTSAAYDIGREVIPFQMPVEGQTSYGVLLWHHDVQVIQQARLWTGMSTDATPVPTYAPIDLDQCTYSFHEERLSVPHSLVADPTLGLGWAVDYVVGLGRLPLSVVQWCALGAAIQALSLAGSGTEVSGGVTSSTLRMDGIEERDDFGGTNAIPYGGIYGGPITILQRARDEIDLRALRFRYQNNRFPVENLGPPGVVYPTRP